ncbi:NAD(P)-dependent oxidoreductase [Bacillus infantis]|uniref:NAD(P)-dependent oxidoreductase n=1 Tax=Bacillus infantis TaxID=324767 RepID=UPI0021555CDB|nr:NAD(P)-dependent oxidoreductase [Bacillus infantis]
MIDIKQKRISHTDLEQNFREVEPALSDRDAVQEANRCLYCYDAPCIKACPTGINIPSFIKKISTGNMLGSAKTIMDANPAGASCSRVCPTEELCEGACVLNSSGNPILIGKLQRHATDWAIKSGKDLFSPGTPNGKKTAIIGSGPAGLSAARELARLGYEAVIYEAEAEAGGLNTYGIVSFRLPKAIAHWEAEQIRRMNVDIRTSTKVGRDVTAEELLAEYDCIVLAAGMSKVPDLGIEGEELEGVLDAIEFVKQTKTGDLRSDIAGKRAVVIGAGNTAIDAATCAARLAAEKVKILYRRTQEEMTAYDFEYEFAKQDGVEFRWLTAPKRIISNDRGEAAGIECIQMMLGEPDQDGRRRPVPIEGSEHVLPADIIVKAIGQQRHGSLIAQFGLGHEKGVVLIDPETLQTTNPKVFACGDIVFGKGKGEAMVVTAAQQGKQAAHSIHKLMQKEERREANG